MLQRLQKIIAQAGIASRRHAEELIRSGQVRVNGTVVTEMGSKADPERDRVEVAGRVAEVRNELVYFLLHKPTEVVSTMADPEGRKTLRHFLRGTPERVFPVGRLDYAASGLVLLTSDGQLAARVLRAAKQLRQTYWIKVKGRISESEMHEAGRAAQAHFAPLKGPWARRSAENPWYEVELTGASRDALGRALKRQDHPIEKMKRVQLGTLEIGAVPEGHYRRLEPAEVEKFSRAVDRALAAPEERPLAAPIYQAPAAAIPSAVQPSIRPPFAAPANRSQFAAPTNRPQFSSPANRPHFGGPRKDSHRSPSQGRPPQRKDGWRGRSDGPPRNNKFAQPPHSARPSRPPNDRAQGPPSNRPQAPPSDRWRGQKSSGPWRGSKIGGAPKSPNHPRPGAPKHRPSSPAKGDWRAQKSGPWRGNKTGDARKSGPWRGNKSTGAQKSGPWRGSKPGGAPRSPNRPPSSRPPNSSRPQNSRPAHKGRSDGGPRDAPHRPPRPSR